MLGVLFTAVLALSLFYPAVAAAQEVKQIKLTEKHMEDFIAVSEDVAQLYDGASQDKSDPKLEAQAEALVKRHGFASLDEYEVPPKSGWHSAAEAPHNFRMPVNAEQRPGAGSPAGAPQRVRDDVELHGGAAGSGAPPGKRNGQYRHGERTKGSLFCRSPKGGCEMSPFSG
jgi:hypothetical protein